MRQARHLERLGVWPGVARASSTPASSNSSRAAAVRASSPGSAPPPGNTNADAMNDAPLAPAQQEHLEARLGRSARSRITDRRASRIASRAHAAVRTTPTAITARRAARRAPARRAGRAAPRSRARRTARRDPPASRAAGDRRGRAGARTRRTRSGTATPAAGARRRTAHRSPRADHEAAVGLADLDREVVDLDARPRAARTPRGAIDDASAAGSARR